MKAKACLTALVSRSGTGRIQRPAFTGSSRAGNLHKSVAPSLARTRLLAVTSLLTVLVGAIFLSAMAFGDTEFGEEGQASGILNVPVGVGIDQSNGDIYVGDGFNKRVAKFESSTNPLFAWGWGIENGAEEEQTCTTSCLQYGTPFTHNTVLGPAIDSADAVAVDPSGEHDVYVVDGGYGRIEKFKPNGEFVLSFGADTVAYGPDNSSNNEVQTLKVKASGGYYELRLEYPWARAYNEGGISGRTSQISATATAGELESALNAMSTVNGAYVSGGKVSVTETAAGEYELTFENNLGGDIIPLLRPEYCENGGNECSPGNSNTLTGGEQKVETEVTHEGGAGEVCRTSNGDVCKDGSPSNANGEFRNGSHYAGKVYEPLPENPIIGVSSTGTVYVGDNKRVQEFNPEGEYTGQFSIATAAGHNNFVRALTVDGSGNVYVVTEETSTQEEEEKPGSYKKVTSGVQEYDSSGTLIRTLQSAPSNKPVNPTTLAVDEHNDVFVGEQVNNPGEPIFTYEFAAYKPDGTHYAQFGSNLIKTSCNEYLFVGGAAIGFATNHLYVTNRAYSCTPAHHVVVVSLAEVAEPGEPIAGEEEATNIEPTTASLHAVVNPKGNDTHYHFEYVDQNSYDTEGKFASPHKKSTTSTDLGLVIQNDPVQAAISGLKPGTVYHWRVVAESSAGTVYGADETFEALTPVSVRNFTTQTVASELVTLKAELNPNGQQSSYRVRLGQTASYGTEQEGTLELGNEFEPTEVTFTGLKPNTTYHYQIVAENAYDEQYGGPYETQDQTFTTERSEPEERSAERCPNTNLREENVSLRVPDCRAYEQVTPTEKFGGEAFPYLGLSPNGERVLWYSEGAFAGAENNDLFIPYITERSETGWSTQAMVRRPLPPPVEPLATGLNFDPEMDRWLFYESEGLNAEESAFEQGSVFLSMGLADGSTIVRATPTIELVEGEPDYVYEYAWVAAASNDFSRFFIITSHKLLQSDPRPDEGGIGEARGSRIYEVSGVGGPNPTIRLVTELAPQLVGGYETGCIINNDNVGIGGGLGADTQRFTSANGEHLFYTAPVYREPGKCGEGRPNPIGIFAQTGSTVVQLNAPPAGQCTSGHLCATAEPTTPIYDFAAEDGSRVWFTTKQPLINTDNDNTNDLYVAKLAPTGQLEELELASGGNATATHPTPGTGADVGETGVTEEGGSNPPPGVVRISADGTHGAFESPAVLTEEPNSVNQDAVKGANNLYVFDASTGETKFVAELCSGPEESGSEYSKYTAHHNHKLEIGITSVRDTQCPTTISPWMQTFADTNENDNRLWGPGLNGSLARMTPDGRFLVFLTYGRLTPDDTDNVYDLYRYDFETGELERLSFGHNGNDANGNDNQFPVNGFNENGGFSGNGLAENGGRNITAGGSAVIFETAAPLVGHDHNTGKEPECSAEGTGCDVYEWEEDGQGTCTEAGGCVDLISDGAALHGSEHGVIGASGKDIAFQTSRQLAPGDTNGTGDIYDARVNGGFHAEHQREPCETFETCRGPEEAEPSAPKLGSQEFNGPPNAPLHLKCARGKVRVIKHNQVRCAAKKGKHKHHRRHHKRRGGSNRRGAK